MPTFHDKCNETGDISAPFGAEWGGVESLGSIGNLGNLGNLEKLEKLEKLENLGKLVLL